MKEILNVIHNTIYQFFDVCGDDEEVPMSDKDELLLEVNKAICNNLKAMPPIKPDQKTGHWTREEHPDAMPGCRFMWRCSRCDFAQSYGETPFCMECGAPMEKQA